MTSNLMIPLKHLCNYINTDSSSSVLMCLSDIKLSGLDSDVKNEPTSINRLIPVVSNFPLSPTIFPCDETKQKQFLRAAERSMCFDAISKWSLKWERGWTMSNMHRLGCGLWSWQKWWRHQRSAVVMTALISSCFGLSFKTPTVASVSSKHLSVHVECSKTMHEHNKAQLKIN